MAGFPDYLRFIMGWWNSSGVTPPPVGKLYTLAKRRMYTLPKRRETTLSHRNPAGR